MSIRSPHKTASSPVQTHPHSRYHYMPPIDFSQEPKRSSNASSTSSESLTSVRRQLPPLEISHSPPRPVLIPDQKWQGHTTKEHQERKRNRGKLFFLPSPVSPSPIYRIPNPFTLPRRALASPQDVSFPATPLSLLAPTPQNEKPERAVDDLVALCQGKSTQA